MSVNNGRCRHGNPKGFNCLFCDYNPNDTGITGKFLFNNISLNEQLEYWQVHYKEMYLKYKQEKKITDKVLKQAGFKRRGD